MAKGRRGEGDPSCSSSDEYLRLVDVLVHTCLPDSRDTEGQRVLACRFVYTSQGRELSLITHSRWQGQGQDCRNLWGVAFFSWERGENDSLLFKSYIRKESAI
jgi:hypothetical protein